PEDCDAIAAEADGAEHAAVIGGGLLGLEAARGIGVHGPRVTVVHLMDRLMERQLDGDAAALLGPALERLGVGVLLERQTERILGAERAAGLRFAGGDELHCDFVVVSIGIRARVELARRAGLACERGILVDERMCTSDPNVVAVGECAQHEGIVYGIVAPIYEQAEVAAETLLGLAKRSYRGSVMSAKLKVMGVDLVSIGAAEGERAVAVADHGEGVYRKLVVRGGRAAGAILMGDTRGHELLLEAVRTEREVSDPLGLLAEASKAGAADLPDTAQVCNCNGVCKGAIVDAVRQDGLSSTAEVMATTRAGTGCGSCKPLVAELVRLECGEAAEEPAYLCACLKQTREELAAQVREHDWTSVSEVATGCGTGRPCGACKPGLAYLVSEINGVRHREERDARFINDRVHANIERDGTFSVVPRIRGGVTSPAELRRIA
ncbi:MAG: FAD-dependent oxidoreductase, partial [Gammaproteobacteria bacterium]